MRVYLSGPMRGLPDKNFPLFNHTAKLLRVAGHDVLNPAESSFPTDTPHRVDCLRHDIAILLVVDAVAVLPDWQNSPGARFEVAMAWQLDLPVYDARSLVINGPYHEGWEIVSPSPVEIPETSVAIPREKQYYNRVPLIGLQGYASAGKDEIAKTLVDDGWARLAFADPLKKIATALGWSGQKDGEGRRFLQDLGVAVRDHLHSDAWVIKTEEQIEGANAPVVITDVRFPNELHMIRRRKGLVVHVERPGVAPANEHISEHAVTASDCDLTFHNDGTLEELPGTVRAFFNELIAFCDNEPVESLAA